MTIGKLLSAEELEAYRVSADRAGLMGPNKRLLRLLDHIAALEAKLAETEKALREATSV